MAKKNKIEDRQLKVPPQPAEPATPVVEPAESAPDTVVELPPVALTVKPVAAVKYPRNAFGFVQYPTGIGGDRK